MQVIIGTYERDNVVISYELTIDGGTWIDPPYTSIEIKTMTYEGVDVYDLICNIADDWYENVEDYIKEHHRS
tara:strand:- start:639 stop:854 length:216 start_codon:yes stop_codon:yes gene_type:complete